MDTNSQKDLLQEMHELISVIHHRINKSMLYGGRKNIPLLPQPQSLVGGTLKDYQLETLAWLVQLRKYDLNGILADDMGLGKTIQAISFLCYIYHETGAKGKHLIVVPKNVLRNWERELNTWTKDFKTVILPGTEMQREQCLNQFIRPKKFDILITTFQSVQTCEATLKRINWKTMILDEAHAIKNENTFLAYSLRRYQAEFKLLMTGTPLSNDLQELWSLLNFILPDIFHNDTLFQRIERTVNESFDEEEKKIKFQAEVAKLFKMMINPFLMRRCKNEIKLGLKEKKEITLFTSLTSLQLEMYRNYLKTKSVYGDETRVQMSSHIQLAKICLHPYMFSDIEDPQAPPMGEHLIENSGKLKLLDKLLKKLIREKHKVLIFSQFTSMMKILEDYCAYRDYGYCLIDGNTSLDARDEAVNNFFQEQSCSIFLISTRAGGIGLNLVAADIVILYDLDWNPQMDKQAMDRAYRIGQKNSVIVFRLITNHTIEERKLEVQKYKLIWDELVIQKGGLARMKSSQEKFEKINYDKIAFSGAEEIFKLQENFDDQAIEDIIKMGEEKDKKKTAEIRKKLQEEMKKYGSAADPYENIVAPSSGSLKNIEYEGKVLGFKNQEKLRKNAKEKFMTKEEAIRMLSKELEPFKFYDDPKKASQLYYEMKNTNQSVEDIENQLRKIGFYDWKLSDYKLFVQACIKFGRKNQLQIQQQMKGKKQSHQVRQYLRAFEEKSKQDKYFLQDLNKIVKAEKKKEEEQIFIANLKRFQQISERSYRLTTKTKVSEKINLNSSKMLFYNRDRMKGVSLDENENEIKVLFPNLINKTKSYNSSQLRKNKFFEECLQEIEKQQEIDKKLKKRYQELKSKFDKLILGDKEKDGKEGLGEEENSDGTMRKV